MGNNLIIVLIAWIGGIITTYVGVLLHSLLGERKQKKRVCLALHEELSFNISLIKKPIELEGNRYSVPSLFTLHCYTEARSSGMFAALPEEIQTPIERCYTFLQFLNNCRVGVFNREEVGIYSLPRGKTEDEVAKEMTEILPKLKEFCLNLRVYSWNDLACAVRGTKRQSLEMGARFYVWVFSGIFMAAISIVLLLPHVGEKSRLPLIIGLILYFVAALIVWVCDLQRLRRK